MQMKSMKVITAAISTSFFLVTIAMAAEKAAVKDAIKEAVKDPKAAAQKVIPKQVRTEGGSATATAAAAKAFEKVSGVKLNYQIGPRRPGDVIAIYANNDLARKQLGWKTEYSLDDMMATAWKWEQKLKADEKFYNGKFSEFN